MTFNNNPQLLAIGQNQVQNFKTENPQSDRYYNYYTQMGDDPLMNCAPILGDTNFFGPKVLNLIVLTQLYGIPNTNWTSSVNKIKASYDQWSKLQTLFYYPQKLLDNIIAGDPVNGPAFVASLMIGWNAIKQACTDNADYGFIWKGAIPSDADYTFFKPVIQDFYENA